MYFSSLLCESMSKGCVRFRFLLNIQVERFDGTKSKYKNMIGNVTTDGILKETLKTLTTSTQFASYL